MSENHSFLHIEMLDWTLLRSFLAVVDSGSLSAAADRLGLVQPTVGRHIRELEETLDTPLFRRQPRGLEPTPAALDLVEDARRMGEAALALERKANALLFASRDQKEGMQAFIEKRTARFEGN